MDTAGRYRDFAAVEARGNSPAYEQLASAVAADPDLLALLDTLPEPRRQPNLLFAAVRYLAGPVDEPAEFARWVGARWPDVAAVMSTRSTQTNEPGRCAVLLPALAALPQPLALLEVGASAGLCLYPDAYRYRYTGAGVSRALGPAGSEVVLDCSVEGPVPLPDRVPTVVWRAGLDLNPLRVDRDDDVRWLESLIWPDQPERAARLAAAVAVARADPPQLFTGDLVDQLAAVAEQAPREATLVVFHSAVLRYVAPESRERFMARVREVGGHWISNEGPGVFPEMNAGLSAPVPGQAAFVLSVDGRPVAFTAPHGQAMWWLG